MRPDRARLQGFGLASPQCLKLLGSIVFEFDATVLPSCGGELDAGTEVCWKLKRGSQTKIPEVK